MNRTSLAAPFTLVASLLAACGAAPSDSELASSSAPVTAAPPAPAGVGAFQTFGSATEDTGYGYCVEKQPDGARTLLFERPCAGGGANGWTATAGQTFQVTSSGTIEDLAVLAGGATQVDGCWGVYQNNYYDGAPIDILPCAAGAAGQTWYFSDGKIGLAEYPTLCVQAPTSLSGAFTLQMCSPAYSQLFTPINFPVDFGLQFVVTTSSTGSACEEGYVSESDQIGFSTRIVPAYYTFEAGLTQGFHAILTSPVTSGEGFGFPIQQGPLLYPGCSGGICESFGTATIGPCGSLASALSAPQFAYIYSFGRIENAVPYPVGASTLGCFTASAIAVPIPPSSAPMETAPCNLSTPSQTFPMTIEGFPSGG
jgi:hypothetical protein